MLLNGIPCNCRASRPMGKGREREWGRERDRKQERMRTSDEEWEGERAEGQTPHMFFINLFLVFRPTNFIR